MCRHSRFIFNTAIAPRGDIWRVGREFEGVSLPFPAPRCYYQGHPEAGLGQKINQASAEGWEVLSSGSDDGCPFVILRKPK